MFPNFNNTDTGKDGEDISYLESTTTEPYTGWSFTPMSYDQYFSQSSLWDLGQLYGRIIGMYTKTSTGEIRAYTSLSTKIDNNLKALNDGVVRLINNVSLKPWWEVTPPPTTTFPLQNKTHTGKDGMDY